MYRSGTGMAWNVFRFCTALRGLGSIMILLVLGVVGVTYYAVVLTTYGPSLADGGLDTLVALLVLIPFHALLAMLLWSYFSVVFTDPGCVPPNWRPAIDEERGETDPLNVIEHGGMLNDSPHSKVRHCRKCNQLKPPRCHHCSVCGRCVLKMDHHCVWVVNCVGALNYKYFLLFLQWNTRLKCPKPSHEDKLRELLWNISSIEIKFWAFGSNEFIRILRSSLCGELLSKYVRTSSKFTELFEAWSCLEPGLSFILSLFSVILVHPEGKYRSNDPNRDAISCVLDKFLRSII